MSSHQIHFYDAAEPRNVPSGSYAAAYVGGSFAWPQDEIDRMRKVFRITEVPGDPGLMRHARCVGVEAGALSSAQAVECCHARHRLGHVDFTAYASLSTMETGLVAALKQTGLPFRLWVAEWDNDPGRRPVIDGVGAWAKQYQGGVTAPFDLSVLYGDPSTF